MEWYDSEEREWVKAPWVAEDLVSDFEAGLDYAVAEAVVEKRQVAAEDGKEKLVGPIASRPNRGPPNFRGG